MANTLGVVLEVGKRRWVAGAMDWPGLDRSGSSEDDAVHVLASYRPRYAAVAERAGMASAFARERDVRLELLGACWAHFDDILARVSPKLRNEGRGGRDRDAIMRHVYATERRNWWRRVGHRAEDGIHLTPGELAAHRHHYLDAIRAYNAQGRPARSCPIQFLVRRTAYHVMDHAWEMEDRDLTPPTGALTACPQDVRAEPARDL